MKFKIGQKWKNRDGDVLSVAEILDGMSYPIMLHDKDGFVYSVGLNGAYYINGQWGSEYDLIELIEENDMSKTMKELYEEIREEEKVQSDSDVETKNSVTETLEQRGSVYGKFSAQLECVTEIISAMEKCARANVSYPYHPSEVDFKNLKTEWFYLAIKLARIASNPEYTDSYHDLAGYAMLLEKEHEHTN